MATKNTNEDEKQRKRNFTCLVYPDSAPSNWLEILSDMKISAFISPLHDKDINPTTNEVKKPHYHVILMFEGNKSVKQVHDIFERFGGVYPPENPKENSTCIVESIRGAARYLQHLDNPEKAYYGDKEVTCLAGADFATVISLESDLYRSIAEMEEFCEQYNVFSFYALSRYATLHRTDWKRCLCTKASFYMKEYLKSRKWSVENSCDHIVDENGEVIV